MATASASFVPEALRIVHRPEQIEQRQLPGHCDDDFIAGAFNPLDPTSLSDAEAAFIPHVVDFQSSHGGYETRLDLFLDPNTKRVPWWRRMALPGRSPHSRRRYSTPASGLIKDGEHGHRRSAMSNDCSGGLFSHLLTRNTKDVAPCFSPKKREARSSD